MITRDMLIEIGHCNKTHGVKGELSVSLDVDVDTLRQMECLVFNVDGIFVPFFVTGCRDKSASTALLRFDGIDTDEQAAMLAGCDVYALKTTYEQLSDEADDDVLPLDYFIGFEIRDGEIVVGNVVDINDATDNVLFVVERPDGSTVQLPAVDDLVADIDDDNRVLVMDLPAGILDL